MSYKLPLTLGNRKWRKAQGLNKLHYWLQHQEARATVRRLITQRRRATWKDFCKRLASCDYTKAISKISRIRKNRTLKPTFSTPDGPQHAADTMASHLETIFSGAHQRTVQYNEITTPALPFAVECPITMDDISSAIRSLPVKKAPGVDHLRIEMLHPIQHLLQPLLLHLFQLNWAWSYVPQPWRVAQVVPIHKKGSPLDPGNYRPISLTTIFRKILERCIQQTLTSEGPPLDIAQGGFRESRSALDQAICLSEICQILRSQFRITPVLAFLDIKSAYDTVNRNFIWETLSQYISPPLLGLLRNLFDDVQIEVLLSNATSRRFRPNTGVLQGSILSPYLYSVYINQLPAQLRPQAFPSSSLPLEIIPSLNCLLYADDVVLIAERSNLVDLLRKCENHSIQMGYKWNPSKCVILDSSTDSITYTLYDQPLPRETTFAYLGVPFKPGGHLDPDELIRRNTQKALATMNILSSVGVNPSGFSKLLCTRFYAHIVRPQLEYGLAINRFTVSQIHALEEAQNNCIKKIYGARGKASTKVMLHMSKLPLLSERVSILQAQFLFRSLYLPEDALLACLLPYIRSIRGSQWYALSRTPLWKTVLSTTEEPDTRSFKTAKRRFLQQNLEIRQRCRNSKLLSNCRRSISLDPILWLPMSKSERSRCIRWRLGWLPGGKPRPCPKHLTQQLSKSHAINCLDMHRRLFMPETIRDPLSFLLNMLPLRPLVLPNLALTWSQRWPIICSILYELDQLHHDKLIPIKYPHGQKLLVWLNRFL
ncbi:hypothetical protein G6F19_005147 [Rhizopus arrhizus]|nr:hypothetical protein G6F19_005147 [Rhizopus arrhizus]